MRPLAEIKNVSKSFPGVKALNNVSIEFKTGEVHGLVGENGAGKSTLIKSIMGVHKLDEGEILFHIDDEELRVQNPIEARKNGLYANYQHVNIAPELSVAENYFLGKLPLKKIGIIDWDYIFKESRKILDRFGLNDIDPKTKIKDLSLAQQSMITISKMTNQKLKLVIFDEPTALLENEKVDVLFNFIKELKAQNIGVIYVSHRLEEILEICDRVTVLKDGEKVETLSIENVTEDKLVSLMVGRKLEDIYNIEHHATSDILLEVKNITKKDDFKNISFTLHKGEILGFFGLVGAGRTEIMRAIFGAESIDEGEIYLSGRKTKVKNTAKAMYEGIGLVPENRSTQGLALGLSVKTNINMTSYKQISKLGFINLKKEGDRSNYYIDKMRIKTPTMHQKVKNLSGGNQQKVVISKLLCRDLEILIFDEPTVGVDVGAKLEIYRLIESLAKEGKGIIVISSYLPEVIGLSDRLMIIREGEIVAEIERSSFCKDYLQEEILKYASKDMTQEEKKHD